MESSRLKHSVTGVHTGKECSRLEMQHAILCCVTVYTEMGNMHQVGNAPRHSSVRTQEHMVYSVHVHVHVC